MTGKHRATLRGMANTLEPLFQVGKNGVTQAVINQVNDAFNTKELIKLKVLLESAPEAPKEIAQKLAQATGLEIVQVIGGSMIFYKENPALSPEGMKKAAKKAARKAAKKAATRAQKAKKSRKAKRVALSVKRRAKNSQQQNDRH
ncbi:MAG TPA: YhbY family RNA-binding protein [Clostridia bacterium]|nr:YhbY family RNA-binding protein [Clostridia bacterium]